jgi:hypothetical protein
MNIIMAEGTIKFNLPEEREDFIDAFNGTAWRIVVQCTLDYLRRQNKNEEDELAYKIRSEIFSEILGIIEDSALTLES